MSREDILLKEYEVCQSGNDAIGSQVWTSTSIFMSVNVSLLGALIYGLVHYLAKDGDAVTCPVLPLVCITILAIGLIIILICWKRWLNRTKFVRRINHKRMRQIEVELGMAKNRLLLEVEAKLPKKHKRLKD